MKSWMKDFILEALLSQDGRCTKTVVLLCALLSPCTLLVRLGRRALLFQVWNEHGDNLTHQLCQQGLAPQPCPYVCVTSLACACKTHLEIWGGGGFLFLSLSLSHPLFLFCCWHCLSSSTDFHLAANSFPQSQMELQPNTVWMWVPTCLMHPICTLIKWESLNTIKRWLPFSVTCSRVKRNREGEIWSSFLFKLYACNQTDEIT